MELKSGVLLKGGTYRIIQTLGRGGFGVTYLAEKIDARQRVCIKEFFPKDFYKRDEDNISLSILTDSFADNMLRYKAKFIKEAKIISTFNHPNIIRTRDIFEENNTAYYVMDYIEGESLSGIVRRLGPLSERDAIHYIRQVAMALKHIHAQQVMHLDVKPANIMVREKGNRAILIDFGLSKHYDVTSGDATSTTPVGVSHGFAPLEQYQQGGVNTFSPETDIYSLGATLYFLVTGNTPPQAATLIDSGLPTLPANLSKGVRMAIEHSMEGIRKNRPHNIDEFIDILDGKVARSKITINDEATRMTSGQQTVAPQKKEWQPSSTYTPPPKKSNRGCWIFILLLIICALAVAVMVLNMDRKITRKKEKARTESVKYGGSRANF